MEAPRGSGVIRSRVFFYSLKTVSAHTMSRR
jgi:hypothetical protein